MTTSIDCERIRISVMATADGEEGPVSHDQVKDHLLECESCRKAVDQLRADPPLPATIQRVGSTENLWPALASRLHGSTSEHVRQNQPITLSKRRATGNGLSRHIALWSTVTCVLVAGVIVWHGGRKELPHHLPDMGISSPLRVTISESITGSVDDPVEKKNVAEAPFSDELNADDIALAVVDETFNHAGTGLVRMRLVGVYKGRLPTGRFDVDQRQSYQVEGTMPLPAARLFTPGNRLALYLEADVRRGWIVTSIRELAEEEQTWRKNVRRFCDVLLACETGDSAVRYQELLAANGDIQLDAPAYYALLANPCPHAVDTIRPLWHQAIAMNFPERDDPPNGGGGGFRKSDTAQTKTADQHPGGQQSPDSAEKELPPSESLDAVLDLPPTLALASLLSQMHDQSSAESVIQYAIKQSPAERIRYFELLPGLYWNADLTNVEVARDTLQKLIAESPASAESPRRDAPESNDEDTGEASETTLDVSDVDRIRTVIAQLQLLIKARNNVP